MECVKSDKNVTVNDHGFKTDHNFSSIAITQRVWGNRGRRKPLVTTYTFIFVLRELHSSYTNFL